MITAHYNNVTGITISHSDKETGKQVFSTSHTFDYDRKKVAEISGFDEFFLQMANISGFSGTVNGQELVYTTTVEITLEQELEIYSNYLSSSDTLKSILIDEMYKITVAEFNKNAKYFFLEKFKDLL